MTPRQFFYPRVVIGFYHTMTSKRKPHLLLFISPSTAGLGYSGPQTSLLHSIFRWSSPTRPSIGNGPIPIPKRWSVFFPRTLPPDQFCSGGSSGRICFLSITFYGLTFSHFSIMFTGEGLSWRPYFASHRATGSVQQSSL